MKKSIIWIIMVAMLSATALSACVDDDYTAEDLRRAQERRLNGEKLNREDSIMLEGFDKWKSEQNKYGDY